MCPQVSTAPNSTAHQAHPSDPSTAPTAEFCAFPTNAPHFVIFDAWHFDFPPYSQSPDTAANSSPIPLSQWVSGTTHPPVARAPQLHRYLSSYIVPSRPSASHAPAPLHIPARCSLPRPFHLHPNCPPAPMPQKEIKFLIVAPRQRYIKPHRLPFSKNAACEISPDLLGFPRNRTHHFSAGSTQA